MLRGLAATVLAVSVGTGCSLVSTPAPSEPATWVTCHGGPADAPFTARAAMAVRRLAAGGQGRLQRVFVAATDQVGAWSWPDGTVVLTKGLVERLVDDEIVAVLAHEIGHLELDDRPGPESLAGGSRGMIAEQAADREGAGMLATQGLDPVTMPRMLRKVAAAAGADTAAGRSALRRAMSLEFDLACERADQPRGTMPRCSR